MYSVSDPWHKCEYEVCRVGAEGEGQYRLRVQCRQHVQCGTFEAFVMCNAASVIAPLSDIFKNLPESFVKRV